MTHCIRPLGLICLSLAILCPQGAWAGFMTIDPAATYLRTNMDPAHDATAYSLTSLGLAPGESITLTSVGTYSRGPQFPSIAEDLIAVFSSTNVLLGFTNLNRVPGAIGVNVNPVATFPTSIGNLATDIPQDFFISRFGPPDLSVSLVIPTGAAYIFFSPFDIFYSDNVSPANDYGVQISINSVPEPASITMLLLGMTGLGGYVLRRRGT